MHAAGFERPRAIVPGNKTFGQRAGAAAFRDSNLEIGCIGYFEDLIAAGGTVCAFGRKIMTLLGFA